MAEGLLSSHLCDGMCGKKWPALGDSKSYAAVHFRSIGKHPNPCFSQSGE